MEKSEYEGYAKHREIKEILEEFHFLGEVALFQAEQNKEYEIQDKLHHIIREIVAL